MIKHVNEGIWTQGGPQSPCSYNVCFNKKFSWKILHYGFELTMTQSWRRDVLTNWSDWNIFFYDGLHILCYSLHCLFSEE